MQADDPVSRRLRVLELAEALGNVSEACRQVGIARSQYYYYRRRFREHGMDGLKNLPPVPKDHPHMTPPAAVKQILALSLEHPTWGCVTISDALQREGIAVTSPTVQKILIKQGLGRQHQRLAELERRHFYEGIDLSHEQIAAIEKANPCFRERHAASARPGELLCQGTITVGRIEEVGRVRLHAVVDTYGGYVFGVLGAFFRPEDAIMLLRRAVFPFYEARRLQVGAILTGAGREFTGAPAHPYPVFLRGRAVEHRVANGAAHQVHGCLERLQHTLRDDFGEIARRLKSGEPLEMLQSDLKAWLADYNTRRPHPGYPNFGRCPIEAIDDHLSGA